jgi:thiamine-monophosphate kinase
MPTRNSGLTPTTRPEFELIERLRSVVGSHPRIPLGIGDDAAALACDGGRETLVATDMLLDGVHFMVDECGPYLAGRKALAVNLSDLAAMGGRGLASFVSIALPQSQPMSWADELMQGVIDLGAEWNCPVTGGDTNSWHGQLVINVAVVGETLQPQSIRRSGAKPGDAIVVTGALGGSIHGRHLRFTPRLEEAAELLRLTSPHAMIDISDGLSSDIQHILAASGVGARIEEVAIPVHPDVTLHSGLAGLDSEDRQVLLTHALNDGEDFELLFTMPLGEWERLQAKWRHPTPLTRIGVVTEGQGCMLVGNSGESVPLTAGGYVHQFG